MTRTVIVAGLAFALVFALGFLTGRRVAPLPRATAEAPVRSAPTVEPTSDRACRAKLASLEGQLAICLAYRGSPESADAPMVKTDAETARLLREHRTNEGSVIVQQGPGYANRRFYGPGTWPPAEGVPSGAHIIARYVDGGVERFEDGGTVFQTVERLSMCPCPPDAGADTSGQ